MVSAAQQLLIDILDYWHKIEFFIPFDLDQITDTEDPWKLRWLRPEHLVHWTSTADLQFDIPDELEICGFRLYLGLFERSEIAVVCKSALPAIAGQDQNEDDERGAAEGTTCFARINLNADGEPLFDPVSISTVPWALGRTQAEGIGSLSAAGFDAAKKGLGERLQQFRSERAPAAPLVPGGPPLAPLSGTEIVELAALLSDWAGFVPAPGQPVLLEILTRHKPREKKQDGQPAANRPAPQANDGEDDEEEEAQAAEPSIDILNSFFIGDIEHAIDAVRAGQAPLLTAYLTPLAQDQRIDLYTSAGRRLLAAQLHPARSNRGHWLSQSSHSMSLMQQFAINTAREEVADGGMFAVNGPPGTGKTTLLREIFADNIVRRASVLAQLSSPGKAFKTSVKVGFADGKSTWIRPLDPQLTGFEMVVASSNNAAVENISGDLPKMKSVGEDWQDVGYLRSVAYRLAAEDDKGRFHPSPAVEPWGLISCALGKSRNRYRFTSKFYQQNWNKDVKPDPRCQNILQWMDAYRGPSFSQAAAQFRELAAQVEYETSALAGYADCWQQYQNIDLAHLQRQEQAAIAMVEQASQAHRGTGVARQALAAQQADLREEERLLDRERPPWWVRWFQPGAMRRYRDACTLNAGSQRALLRQLAAANVAEAAALAALERQRAAVAAAQAAREEAQRQQDDCQQKMAGYRQRYRCANPPDAEALEHDAYQIAGLWHDEALASLRSRLFAAALSLHEAWLAEVGRSGDHGQGFGGNLFALSQLLSNNQPDDPAHVPLIWQSLFMVVPVVSTTFASLARQFRDMGAGSIGWLFIDEAGQAVPQAAVGALWRARRAVVVGDPRQIEPVFTVPLNLIRALSAQSPHTASEDYAPDKVSVQRLADSANRYGALAPQPGGEPLWIGSPLRVHRRCADPMFTLANHIAYDNKMVIEPHRRTPAALKVAMGESAWIEIDGPCSHKQVVPAQIDFVAEVLLALYRKGGELPQVYVISPFKAVREALRKRIAEIVWHGPAKPPSKTAIDVWCKAAVGTVHTFQGKEQAAVLMVLGVDDNGLSSAEWAAGKSNLLNVALTRAQQNFYMIGAGNVWRERNFFSVAYTALPQRSPAQFLTGIGAPEASS